MSDNYSNSITNTSAVKKVLGVAIIVTLSFVIFISYITEIDYTRGELELFTSFNFIVLSIVLAYTLPRGIWSISFIFFVTFGIFHAGLILASSINAITDEDILYQISFWFHTRENTTAISLINIAFVGYAIAAIIFSKNVSLVSSNEDEDFCRRAFHIGGIGLIASIFLFLLIGFGTGAASSYGAYLAIVSAIPLVGILFTYIYLLIGLTLVLVVVSYRKGFGISYFVAFAIWSVIAFRIGLRGEVMFPSAVAIALIARRGKPMSGVLLATVVTVFLIFAGIVKNARVAGDYSGHVSINPMNTVAELGSSLRAVKEVITWRLGGDELLMGASYWAPIERQVALILPQIERLPAQKDDRLLNVKVIKVVGPIGFSLVAEAYINFGEIGVLISAFLFALVFSRCDNKTSNLRTDVYVGVALVPIFVMIRNSFAHVPIQVILGFVLASMLLFLAKKKKKRY